MKKVLVIIELFIIFLILYFLQSNFFSWYNILGIAPNLFIILALFIGLFMGKTYGLILGVIFGLILDFFIGAKIGINAIVMGITGIIRSNTRQKLFKRQQNNINVYGTSIYNYI